MQNLRQLPLPFQHSRDFAPGNFHEAASNTDALAWLSRTTDWPDLRLALWGPAGCGKTHLLHIWAESTGADLRTGTGLSGLPDIPAAGIALDDADAVADEHALLHLLNAAGEAGAPVLLAARPPPARWATHLPDLASRLRAMTTVEIGPPEDTLLRTLLARLLADRQLRLPEPVQEWLVQRLPRSAAALHDAVQRLDAVALDQHHNITVPFAARVLTDLLASDEISGSESDPSQEGDAVL